MAAPFLPFDFSFKSVCILCALPIDRTTCPELDVNFHHRQDIGFSEQTYLWLEEKRIIIAGPPSPRNIPERSDGDRISNVNNQRGRVYYESAQYFAHRRCYTALCSGLERWIVDHPKSPCAKYPRQISSALSEMSDERQFDSQDDESDENEDGFEDNSGSEDNSEDSSYEDESGSEDDHGSEGAESQAEDGQESEESFKGDGVEGIPEAFKARMTAWLSSLGPQCDLRKQVCSNVVSSQSLGVWSYPLANLDLTRKASVRQYPKSEHVDEIMWRLANPYIDISGTFTGIATKVDQLPEDMATKFQASVNDRLTVKALSSFNCNDPFAKISMDTCLEILDLLDFDAIVNLRRASPAVASIHLSNGFFRRMWVRCDMPTGRRDTEALAKVDWKTVYGMYLDLTDNNPHQRNCVAMSQRSYDMAEEIFGTMSLHKPDEVPEGEPTCSYPMTPLVRGRGGVGSGVYRSVMIPGARSREEDFPVTCAGSQARAMTAPLKEIVVYVDHGSQLRGLQFRSRNVKKEESDVFGYGDASNWTKHTVELDAEQHICGIIVGVSTGSIISGIQFCIGVSDGKTGSRIRQTFTTYFGKRPTEMDFKADDGSGFYFINTPDMGQHKVVGITGIVDYMGIRAIGLLETRLDRYIGWWYGPANKLARKKTYLTGPSTSLEGITFTSMNAGPNLILPLAVRKAVTHFPLKQLVALYGYEDAEKLAGLEFEWSDGTTRALGNVGAQRKCLWKLYEEDTEEGIERNRIGGMIVASSAMGNISALAIVTVDGRIGDFVGNKHPPVFGERNPYSHICRMEGQPEDIFRKEILDIQVAYDSDYGFVQLGLVFGNENCASPPKKLDREEVPYLRRELGPGIFATLGIYEKWPKWEEDFIKDESIQSGLSSDSSNAGGYFSYMDLRKPIIGLEVLGGSQDEGFRVKYEDGTTCGFGNYAAKVVREYDWSGRPRRLTTMRWVTAEPLARQVRGMAINNGAETHGEGSVDFGNQQRTNTGMNGKKVLQFTTIDFDDGNLGNPDRLVALYEVQHTSDRIYNLSPMFSRSTAGAILHRSKKDCTRGRKRHEKNIAGHTSQNWTYRMDPHLTFSDEEDERPSMEYILFDGSAGERLQAIAFFISPHEDWKPFVGVAFKREGRDWTDAWGSFYRGAPYVVVWELEEGERVVGCRWRQGAWLDAVAVATQKRCSPFFGKEDGGGMYEAFEDEENIAIGFYHCRTNQQTRDNQSYNHGGPYWGIITRPRLPSDPPYVAPCMDVPSDVFTPLPPLGSIIMPSHIDLSFALVAHRFYSRSPEGNTLQLLPQQAQNPLLSTFVPHMLKSIEFTFAPLFLSPFISTVGVTGISLHHTNGSQTDIFDGQSDSHPGGLFGHFQGYNHTYGGSQRTDTVKVEMIAVRGMDGERIVAWRTWARKGITVGVEVETNWGRWWQIGETGGRVKGRSDADKTEDMADVDMDVNGDEKVASGGVTETLELVGSMELRDAEEEALGFFVHLAENWHGNLVLDSIQVVAVDLKSVAKGETKFVGKRESKRVQVREAD